MLYNIYCVCKSLRKLLNLATVINFAIKKDIRKQWLILRTRFFWGYILLNKVESYFLSEISQNLCSELIVLFREAL